AHLDHRVELEARVAQLGEERTGPAAMAEQRPADPAEQAGSPPIGEDHPCQSRGENESVNVRDARHHQSYEVQGRCTPASRVASSPYLPGVCRNETDSSFDRLETVCS